MVEWHDIVWFKNAVPRHSFLLWMAVQQKLTTQDRLHRFGIHGPNRCSLCLRNNEDHNHLFLNAPILKRSGGMFVTDATFQEWQKAGMNGFDRPLSLGMARVLSIFLINWVLQLQCIMYGKNGMQGSLLECLELRIWSLIKSNVSFTISLI